MRTHISTALAATFLFSTSIFADPISLSNTQMDQVTAGTGANNVAVVPWAALGSPPQSFAVAHLPQAENGIPLDGSHAAGANPAISGGPCGDAICGVAVPSVVPGSDPF